MNAIPEMKKKYTEGINSILNEAEYWLGDLQDKVEHNTHSGQQKEKKRIKKDEGSLRDLWKTI